MEPSIFNFILFISIRHGCIDIIFNEMLNVKLDLLSDFSVCFEDIIDSINAEILLHKKV